MTIHLPLNGSPTVTLDEDDRQCLRNCKVMASQLARLGIGMSPVAFDIINDSFEQLLSFPRPTNPHEPRTLENKP